MRCVSAARWSGGDICYLHRKLPKKRRLPVQRKRSAGPIKSTPVSLLARSNQDIWKVLAENQTADNRARDFLTRPIVSRQTCWHLARAFSIRYKAELICVNRNWKTLAELVSLGRVCSDSFTGLRALLTPHQNRSSVSIKGSRKAMFGLEDAAAGHCCKPSPVPTHSVTPR